MVSILRQIHLKKFGVCEELKFEDKEFSARQIQLPPEDNIQSINRVEFRFPTSNPDFTGLLFQLTRGSRLIVWGVVDDGTNVKEYREICNFFNLTVDGNFVRKLNF